MAGSREVLTSCTCDCPDTCSILASVAGGRVTAIRGNPDFKLTAGFLCRKSRGFLKRVHSPERLLHPVRRSGAGWERITWDDAAGLIAGKIDAALARYGPKAVFYFQEAGSISALRLVNQRFFNLLGGGTFSSGSLCGGAGIAGQCADFGERTAHDPLDLLNSKLVIIWGRNPAWTNVHLLPILREARAHGTVVVLIDPVATATSKLVDVHVAPRPGTDGFLALGMARLIVEEHCFNEEAVGAHSAGFGKFLALTRRHSLEAVSEITAVTFKQIKDLAWMYARVMPAAIVAGWGLQRRRNGANIYRLIDALAALTRNIGIKGGGVSHGLDETRWFDRRVCLVEAGKERREIPRPRTGRGLLDAAEPPIKVAVVSGGNPVGQCPDTDLVRRGFEAVDFKVVLDMFLTDTARLADVVLPTTHFLQETDVVGSYWHNYVMPVAVAQERLGEEKTDLEIFALLAGKLGLGSKLPADPVYFLDRLLAPLAAEGISPARIAEGPVRPRGAVDVPFAGRRFKTASGKFEFVDAILPAARPEAAEFPYHLLSPHPNEVLHSQLAGKFEPCVPEARISPYLAGILKVADGDRVVVETARGSLACAARVDGGVAPSTVVINEGSWESLGGSVNRLTSDQLSDQGECATYNDVLCRVGKAVGGGA